MAAVTSASLAKAQPLRSCRGSLPVHPTI
jgi:hypothetical protein